MRRAPCTGADPIVLAFIIFHLLQFTAGYIHPHATFVAGDVYQNVVSGFQVWWVSAWYIFALILLGLHLSHGLYSMFQSVGLAHPRLTRYLKVAAQAIATHHRSGVYLHSNQCFAGVHKIR